MADDPQAFVEHNSLSITPNLSLLTMKLAVALTLAASANAFAPTPVGNVSRKKNVKNGPSELHEIDRDQNGTWDAQSTA